VSVKEEFWVSPWIVSHAKNVIRGAYDDGGHFICYIVEVRLITTTTITIITSSCRNPDKLTKEIQE